MCAYATYEELQSSYGEDRVRRMFAKQTNEALEDYVQRKLEAAAGFMDSYFAKVYATPIDTTVPAVGEPGYDSALRLSAMLSEVNICLAIYRLTTGSSDLRDSISEHYRSCLRFLEAVMVGEVALPNVPQARRIFSVVGPSGQDSLADDPLITTTNLELHRVLEVF